jgi:hypothetical protein
LPTFESSNKLKAEKKTTYSNPTHNLGKRKNGKIQQQLEDNVEKLGEVASYEVIVHLY